jgi:two-component system, OmpR family, sensor histidine kinase CiaH
MPFSLYKTKRLRYIFLVYWFLLAYIIAALVWWFIALNQLNHQMADYEIAQLNFSNPSSKALLREINSIKDRKTAQYIGEGSIFLLLILSGAVFIYRAVRRQFKMGHQQQNFMMAITHELKTPIAVAKLNLETLQKRKLDESQQQRLLQNTIQEANRLNALCNNLLLASQIDAGGYRITKGEVNLTGLVNECVADFSTRYPQRVFHKAVAEEVYINGDMLLLQMAVNNLIDNAIKYSPKDASVSIELQHGQNNIKLMIKDTGKGIDADEKKRVFDKFYRIGNAATKGAKGTGLGLYLTKKIVEQHQAIIFVTDNAPAGSNFTIVFRENG